VAVDVNTIVSVLTLVFGLLVKLVGFPEQFVKNRARKSTEGMSRSFYFLAVVSYTLWSLQGWLAHDWVVVWGQGVGVVTSGAIIGQIIAYRRRLPTVIHASPEPPPPDGVQVRIRRILGRTTAELPGDLAWPPPGAMIVARRVGEGVLLTVADEARPPPHAQGGKGPG
jgi:uncharacterized protein with PQ loop repeat